MSDRSLERVRAELAAQGVEALLLGPGADLRYLTGYHALALERLTMLVVPVTGPTRLLVPELERARAEHSGVAESVEVVTFTETEDPIAVVRAWVATRSGRGPFAVQDRLWTSFTLALQSALPEAAWIPGSQVMRPLRIVKDADELAALAAAAHAIDAVHARVPELLRVDRSERDVGRELAELILEDHDEVNFVIVASGPNGASPHHETGHRRLEPGDAVVIDIGGTRAGYCSDQTRNYVIGSAPPGYAEMHRLLEEAQSHAVRQVRPGVTAASIDAAARSVIGDGGYGPAFIHRTGHGIGVEEHEPPWIVDGDQELLCPGMTFSVEPGIYLEGRWGARIEDIVVVTAGGVEVLNQAPRSLRVCPG